MKKKVLTIVLSTAMILSLCGCGGGKAEEATEPTETEVSVVSEEEEDEEEYTTADLIEDELEDWEDMVYEDEPEYINATSFDEIPENTMNEIIAEAENGLTNEMGLEVKLIKAVLMDFEGQADDNNIHLYFEAIKDTERNQGKYVRYIKSFDLHSDGTLGYQTTGILFTMLANEEELQAEYDYYNIDEEVTLLDEIDY